MFCFTELFFGYLGFVLVKAENLKKQVAARISSILEEKDWSNNQLGREAELPKSFISTIMAGEANLTLETIEKLENALKTPIIRVLKPKDGKNVSMK